MNLEPGVYVSRKDAVGGETVTTFDLRLTAPNKEPVMNTAEIHTLEHLVRPSFGTTANSATRCSTSAPWAVAPAFISCSAATMNPRIFCPCSANSFSLREIFAARSPGAAARDCGNYLDMNLPMANWESARYLERALNAPKASQLRYPE